jgi:serine/threonine-protein kinase
MLFPADDGTVAQTFDAHSSVQLGHFAIIERIRAGGMGAVFRALDTRLNRVVALKVLPPALSRDPLIVQRFKNEGQAAAQLDHENVARVYFIGEEQGLHYIAFEFIKGTNVRELIAEQTRLAVGDALNFALQIASALVHTSAQGVVHRDIKPSNIIITPFGRAKLVDLGLARKENKDEQAVDLTVAGTTLGTFDYISPEQARDPRSADVRSDIYSLGCTLYHMLTGEPPYPDGTVLQKLLQHQGDDAPDPSRKNRQVPENLSVVVRKMMAKDPRRRYQTAEQLVRDLMLVAGAMGLRSISPEGLVWLASQPEQAPFWQRHLAWMLTAALLLVIVGSMEFVGRILSPTPEAASSSGVRPLKGQTASNDERGPKPRAKAVDNPTVKTAHPDREIQDATGTQVEPRQSPAADDSQLTDESDEAEPPRSPIEVVVDERSESHGSLTPVALSDGTKRPNAGDTAPNAEFPMAAAGPLAESTRKAAGAPSAGIARSGRPTNDDESPDHVVVRDDNNSTGSSLGNSVVKSSAAKTLPGKTGERAADDETPAAAAAEEEGFFLLGRDGAANRRFATLEAACAQVRDGAIIELKFNGRRRESRVRINRKVTIRAAKGYRPVVEFRPTQNATEDYQARAVWIPSGSLEISGIDIVLSVDETISAEQWSLFSLERPDALRMERVAATLVNPRQRPVALVELRSPAGASMPDMPVAGAPPRLSLEVEIIDSLIRGDGDLFVMRHAEPARLAIKQSVVALSGALFTARGNSDSTHENAQVELRLDHLTAVLAGGLIRLESGNVPRKLLPVQVSASNCIFSNAAGVALVAMAGSAPPQDYHELLFWGGHNNFYDRYPTLWSIASTQEAAGRSENLDSTAWRRWTESTESNPQFDPVIWKRRPWMTRPFAMLMASDFTLDRQVANNPAVGAAANFTDAGAKLEALPEPAFNGGGDERLRE